MLSFCQAVKETNMSLFKAPSNNRHVGPVFYDLDDSSYDTDLAKEALEATVSYMFPGLASTQPKDALSAMLLTIFYLLRDEEDLSDLPRNEWGTGWQ